MPSYLERRVIQFSEGRERGGGEREREREKEKGEEGRGMAHSEYPLARLMF